MRTRTLRFKLIGGFILILIPLAVFLFYNNYYAMRVVREEVTHSTRSALSFYVSQVDKELGDCNSYLLRQATSDSSYPYLIDLSIYSSDKWEYFRSKQWILRTFSNDLGSYKTVDAFFAFSKQNEDLIATQRSYAIGERNDRLVRAYINGPGKTEINTLQTWQVYQFEGRSYLIRLVQAADDVYVGALVDVEQLLAPLAALDTQGHSRLLLQSMDGMQLAGPELTGQSRQLEKVLTDNGVYKDPVEDKRYMLAAANFQSAAIRLIQIIPEQEKLQRLPFFQRVILFIPLGALVLLYLYSLFLKLTLLAPMNALIKGMRKIMEGNFEVRLKEDKSMEFQFLIETFNKMVSQMRHLKIHVYEEKLKSQKSELKHLQAQINPHFYLNSLNIIHSLSLLGENRLVEKMAEHLADYFRFITRSHRDSITLAEEFEHIRNYMEIQSLRFPDKLTYGISLHEDCQSISILPLTVQPFVENAIVHGMDKGSAGFHVGIEARVAGENKNMLEITIADNGRGFRQELLERFKQEDFGTGTGPNSLGIWNVLHRLRMKYGDKAVACFENGETCGAVIRLLLPVCNEDQGGGTDV